MLYKYSPGIGNGAPAQLVRGLVLVDQDGSERQDSVELLAKARHEHSTVGVVPMVDTHLAKEPVRTGDFDGAIEVCRSVVDDEFDMGDMLYRGLAATVLVESLLRVRALLARAHGDEAAYRDFVELYRVMATSLGFEGHMSTTDAMT